MRALWLGIAVQLLGCGDKSSSAPVPPPHGPAVTAPTPPPAKSLYPTTTRSLRLTKTIAVRHEPGDKAKQIGTIAQETRVAWTRSQAGTGCKQPWIEIAPRGWVCGDYLEASTKEPLGVELPRLARGEIVPGTYGKLSATATTSYRRLEPDEKRSKKVAKPAPPKKPTPDDAPVTSLDDLDERRPDTDPTREDAGFEPGAGMEAHKPLIGSITVRKWGEASVGGTTYWKISRRDNEYVPRSQIHEHKPSPYQGARLGDDTGWAMPIGFVWPKGGSKASTRKAAVGGGFVRQIAARTVVPILQSHVDERGTVVAYRIGEAEWIDARALRVADVVEPPPLVGPAERWIDVDLDRQIMIAYEGRTAVYATMMSSGTKDSPTETGVFRMWKKMSETDMSDLTAEDPYSVATVPWAQFFLPERGLAIHTAYWHDKFGITRSHGCVNLAPIDARWTYFWSEPLVPPGWTMAAGIDEAPGSIVRVRTDAEPNPPFKGYAKRVQENRASRGR